MNATDVFVIGGGPAGLAAAIAARQRGFRVVVADGGQPPIDKACGEGLMPDGLAALRGLGVRLSAADGNPFLGIRFLTHELSADAPFPAGECGIAIRRTNLHTLLADRAADVGAQLWWRTPVNGISPDGVRVGERMVRARWIVGADGSNSRVRRWAGLERGSPNRLRFAFRQHFRVAPWSDHMEVYWGDRCQGYMAAIGRDEVCVAIASDDRALRLEQALQELPRLNAHLRGAEAVSAERGALTANRSFRRIWKGNVVLIGDAAGTVDAISGEGLRLAFHQAVALAECLEACDLASYQAEHRRLALRPLLMARLMLLLDQRPRLQRRTLQAFQKQPASFRRLLELHIGASSPVHAALGSLSLGWGLLTA